MAGYSLFKTGFKIQPVTVCTISKFASNYQIYTNGFIFANMLQKLKDVLKSIQNIAQKSSRKVEKL
jgi:hypothetical protein